MNPIRLGLASRSKSVALADLVKVASAIALQVARDFLPIWNVMATVSALADPDSIPPGVWPIFVTDDAVGSNLAGLHLNKAGQPYALIQAGATWSLPASHECLEMLVDPTGNRLAVSTGIDVVDGKIIDTPERKFSYIVEVGDPSEDPKYAYLIDDVLVSDFYTPHFFDTVASSGIRYSFTGSITQPRQILDNGYISWLSADMDTLFQLQNFAGAPQILSGNPATGGRGSLRGASDTLANMPVKFSDVNRQTAAGGFAEKRAEWLSQASAAHASTYNWLR